MTTVMAVTRHDVGAVGGDLRASPGNKLSDTSVAAFLLGSCGMLPLVGFAIPNVVVLLRRGTSGTDGNDAWSAIEGDSAAALASL